MEELKNSSEGTFNNLIHWIDVAYSLGFCPIALKIGHKYPLLKEWSKSQRSLANLKQIKYFIKTNIDEITTKGGGFGVLTGEVSGIVVVDIDVKNNGVEVWNELISKNSLPDTLSVVTGSGGYHYYFKYDERTKQLTNKSNALGDGTGIDIRTNGGQIVFISSVHPVTKQEYRINTKYEITTMPDWLYCKLTQKPKKDPITNPKNSDTSLIVELLNLLNPSRVDNYDDWVKVGMILNNELGDEGKDIWMQWSKKSEKFDSKVIESKWNSFKSDKKVKVTLGSLHFLASEDNSKDYKRLIMNRNKSKIDLHEDYYFSDLNVEIKDLVGYETVFDSYGEAYGWLKEKLGKCVRMIGNSETTIIVKENPSITFNVVNYSKFKRNHGHRGSLYKENDDKIKTCTISSILTVDSDLDSKEIIYTPYHDKDPHDQKKYMNIFPGYQARKVDKVDMEKIAPILSHMKEILSYGNDEYFQYMLLWFAFCFQRPTELTEVMMVFYGDKGGEGKSLFLDWVMTYLFGIRNSSKFSSIDRLKSWSGNMKNKLFIWIDEFVSVDTNSGDFTKPFDELKMFFTDDHIESNSKFEMTDINRNYVRIMGTNNRRPTHLKNGWERRLWFTKVSPEKRRDYAYFRELRKSLNQEAANHFFTYVMEMDIKDKIIQEFPITKELEDIREMSRSLAERYLEGIKDQSIPKPLCFRKQSNETQEYYAFHTDALYREFKDWCHEGNYNTPKEIEFRYTCKTYCTEPGSTRNRIFINGIRKVGWYWFGLGDLDE